MKKMNKKAFTLIEVIVVVAIIGILVLLAVPRFIGHTQKAELARIQHDVKMMERELGAELINKDDFDNWENNIKNLNQLAQDDELFQKEGRVAKDGDPIDGTYKVIPEEYKDKINTKLKGTFYANSHGKVYYEHGRGLGYSDEEIDNLVYKHKYIPVATADELDSIRNGVPGIYGEGTKWRNTYTGGLDKQYVQVKNVNLSGYGDWTPIGTWSEKFTGSYDGNGYKITGLTINRPETSSVGLFGVTEGATIDNVALENVDIKGNESVGGLVAHAYFGTNINNSYATGSVTGTSNAGGLVGLAWSRTVISNSYATGSVTGTLDSVGGLVGDAGSRTKIINSYATGSVEGRNYVGGLVGDASSNTISNSYATGSVKGSNRVGGLVGEASTGVTIENSYAKGSVTGTRGYVGGLVGDAYYLTTISNSYSTGDVTGAEERVGGLAGRAYSGTISNSYATGSVIGVIGTVDVGGFVGFSQAETISNSYATGSVSGAEKAGGFVGRALSSTISNSYWDTDTTKQTKSSGGGIGKTSDEMKLEGTYEGWEFGTIWTIQEGEYPTLINNPEIH